MHWKQNRDLGNAWLLLTQIDKIIIDQADNTQPDAKDHRYVDHKVYEIGGGDGLQHQDPGRHCSKHNQPGPNPAQPSAIGPSLYK